MKFEKNKCLCQWKTPAYKKEFDEALDLFFANNYKFSMNLCYVQNEVKGFFMSQHSQVIITATGFDCKSSKCVLATFALLFENYSPFTIDNNRNLVLMREN